MRDTFHLLTDVFFLAAAAALAIGATTFISGAVGGARSAGGWLVDHFAPARVGTGAAPMLARRRNRFEPRADAAERGLAAGAIAQYWHKNQFGLVASRLYIAWCAAAVSFPVLAGRSSIAPEATRRQHGSPPASTSSARA